MTTAAEIASPPATAAKGAPPKAKRPRWRISIAGLVGLVIVLFWLVMAIIGPAIAPHDIGAIVSPDVFAPVSAAFPLGTDYLGRDMLSRVLYGARYTVGVALVATLLACSAGVALGLIAAGLGGWVDTVLSRTLDTLISIPSKMFALLMVAAFGSDIWLLIMTAAIIYTPGSYRIARSLAVNINAMDYVQVARARGEGLGYITRVEILPNIIAPVLADFGLRFVYVVLLLSGMSFLGLGVQPPFADWGSLVRENVIGLDSGAAAVVTPALAIATLTIGINLLIDNLPGRRRTAQN
ncbi:MAG TPA: ABC transporter permease [Burkholderiaceae bacterium]|nr:ABC transporter permease [Burkholderiaceae bacterium]